MGGIMRVLIAFSAIALMEVMSFGTVPAFAAKSCDEYCASAFAKPRRPRAGA